ncbi:hypothetical protein [Terricaulis sp.]|uniref:hypothetical protein n=1 Tax=Terricaulis sp. TaxID=2768686 RepID=UPI003783CFB4
MRLILTALALAGALCANSCALTSAVRSSVARSFCDARDGWTPIPPPPDAQAFRDALAQDEAYARVSHDPAFWFAGQAGEVRLCHSPLRRAEYTHPRRRGCDTRIVTMWDFRRTESGPVTEGAIEQICVT